MYIENILLYAVKRNDLTGYIDRDGRLVVDYQFTYGTDTEDGMIAVSNNDNRSALMNADGELQTDFIYDTIWWMAEKRCVFHRKDMDKYGLMDDRGNIILPAEWDSISIFSSGRSTVNLGPDEWVIDLKGNRLFKNTYGSLPSYFRNRVRVFTGGQIDGSRCGFIDQDGSLVIPFIYMDGLHFWDPVTNVSGGKSDFCIDMDGNVLLEVSHSNYRIQAVCDSRVIISDEDEDRFGVLDMDGRVIVPLYYQSAASFGYKEGLLNVSDENDKYGYIDRSGKLVIECKFDFARPFEGGAGEIFLDKPEGAFEGLIRPDGEFLLAPEYKYETIRYRGGSVWSAETYEGREILINDTGKVIWDSDTA